MVELADRTYEADQVVIATGPFQVPFVPPIADHLDPDVVAAAQHRVPLAGRPARRAVLVVGGGNTGFQIAEELARSREVHLAVGARQTPLPQRILGRDLFRYLEATGLMGKNVTPASVSDSRIATPSSAPARAPPAKQGIRLRPRATEAAGPHGHVRRRHRSSPSAAWSGRPASARPLVRQLARLRRRGHPRTGAASPRPGLYFLGLPWQHTRGSALLGWVKDDAEYLAHLIRARTPSLLSAARSPASPRR